MEYSKFNSPYQRNERATTDAQWKQMIWHESAAKMRQVRWCAFFCVCVPLLVVFFAIERRINTTNTYLGVWEKRSPISLTTLLYAHTMLFAFVLLTRNHRIRSIIPAEVGWNVAQIESCFIITWASAKRLRSCDCIIGHVSGKQMYYRHYFRNTNTANVWTGRVRIRFVGLACVCILKLHWTAYHIISAILYLY